ncbi:MAG: protein-export membrane protein SecF [Candidatus Yanofskybacteria bacterium RIFCSPHIGHO2_02_FULL_44_12b]|uniref:Protein-export membrane protein SecF n=2 Tax=Candidatus Yanofskyibacteriota TaxID=1752733 RepID=A0A1F8GMU2_9BACT|nr:MAG: Protein translocase subunit SecF [Candidatus Yanofskybacteria bacterium GW2011_GWA2_44_9]OGN04669.1 MAG: protein-export membrane protein SecF [Candidatus Yanofskybacteria bacterium RIFCSPHIGHO2_01_FULL_44_24]OGN15666.1 MAG: protein-export membrane protein SecF [Candidatus Yanofskybacteria bacterium RIFCSPHIGHO2_02_FULL_44_12b]OGN26722.1 MAG: protein-export membrane protein SecF [Candidatus Yanofskybacteria bacterium RIFCSPLOWO2_01_FULL_44_22]
MHPVYKIMFFLSAALTLAALAVVLFFGLNFGVDFRGGSVMEVEFAGGAPSIRSFTDAVTKVSGGAEMNINSSGDRGFILRTKELNEAEHQDLFGKIKGSFSDNELIERRFDSVGPVIGQELKSKSITAIVLVLLGIVLYIALVFRKLSKTLSPWIMSFSVIAALLHDIIIPIGVFSLLGKFYNVEIGAVFVAAILTILGYSVSDSVVIFDRIRENIIRGSAKEGFVSTVHKSIMQTLSRSLNTTFTTLLSLVAIYLFGGESVRYFALALIIGIFLGAYSSIFVASPLLVWFNNKAKK